MRTRIIIIGVLILLCAATLILGQSGNDLFQQGLLKEADGDIQGAIQIYDRIVKNFSSNRELAAKALLRLGACSERLGQAKGRDYYEQIVRNYSDQVELVAEARKHLAPPADGPIEIATPYTDDPYSFALSPDGRSLVFQATVDGKSQLWLEQLDSRKASPIAGTENAGYLHRSYPFWSPDGRSIGFFVDHRLKRIDLAEGKVKTLAYAARPYPASWGNSGIILFTPYAARGGLSRVTADGGGDAVDASAMALQEPIGYFPEFLPDGRHFFFVKSESLSIGSLDSLETRDLFLTGSPRTVFVPPDYILYVADRALTARRFDLQRLELSGSSIRLADRVTTAESGEGTTIRGLSASATGAVAYRIDSAAKRQLVWLNRQGRQTGTLAVPDYDVPSLMRFSPDGQTVAFIRFPNYSLQGRLLVIDVAGGTPRQVNTAVWSGPVWSPQGDRIAFARRQPLDHFDLYDQTLDDGGLRPLANSEENKFPEDYAPDGSVLLYKRLDDGSSSADLLALQLQGGDPIPIAVTEAEEWNARFAPNSRWIAYESNEVGARFEIYVQPFPGSIPARKKVSLNGGKNPQWRRDGKELYFLSLDNHLMVVDVTFSADGQTVEFSAPKTLFASRLSDGTEYAASPDGQRFLINPPIEAVPPILILPNALRGKR